MTTTTHVATINAFENKFGTFTGAQAKRGDRNNRVTLAEWNGSNFIVEFHDAFYGDHVHYIVPFTGNSGLVAFEYVA